MYIYVYIYSYRYIYIYTYIYIYINIYIYIYVYIGVRETGIALRRVGGWEGGRGTWIERMREGGKVGDR